MPTDETPRLLTEAARQINDGDLDPESTLRLPTSPDFVPGRIVALHYLTEVPR